MRNLFGILAIGLAVIALGVFRVPDENALVAAGIEAAARGELYQAHPLTVSVTGRVVTVAGRVESEAAGRAVVRRLGDLDGVERVVDDLTILPSVSPFALEIEQGAAAVRLAGHVPDAALAEALGTLFATDAEALVVATGAPDGAWSAVARLGAAQLASAVSGRMALRDRVLEITADVHLPSDLARIEAALKDLPEDYRLVADWTVLDDGTPYRLHIARDPFLGLRVAAKLPPDFDPDGLSILGPAQENTVTRAQLPLESPGFADAVAAVLPLATALPQGSVTVADGLVTWQGGPVPPELITEIDALEARLPEGYAQHLALVPEDAGEPWSVTLEWTGETLDLRGHVPLDFDADALASRMEAPLGAVVLKRSPYRDLDGWVAPLAEAVGGLRLLDRATATLGPEGLDITGIAADPLVRRRASTLAGGLALDAVFLADDGRPVAFRVDYDASSGGVVSGKLPASLRPEDLARALGLSGLRGAPRIAPEGAAPEVPPALQSVARFHGEIERATLDHGPDGTALRIEASPGVSSAALQIAFETALGESVAVTVFPAEPPVAGARRVHAALRIPQIFVAGHWLPALIFTPSPENCAAELDRAPEIPFDPGRFLPALEATLALDYLAAVVRSCTRFAGLQLRIEARAGSAANDTLNAQLARRRAEALRAALVARGIAEAQVTAYGRGAAPRDQLSFAWQ